MQLHRLSTGQAASGFSVAPGLFSDGVGEQLWVQVLISMLLPKGEHERHQTLDDVLADKQHLALCLPSAQPPGVPPADAYHLGQVCLKLMPGDASP